jgi:uncharacterized protein YyaL (SSP411 family)
MSTDLNKPENIYHRNVLCKRALRSELARATADSSLVVSQVQALTEATRVIRDCVDEMFDRGRIAHQFRDGSEFETRAGWEEVH